MPDDFSPQPLPYAPLSMDVLSELLDNADAAGLYEFDIQVEREPRSPEEGGDVFYIIGSVAYED